MLGDNTILAVIGAVLAMLLWSHHSGKVAGKRAAKAEAAKDMAAVVEEVAVVRAKETHALDRPSKFNAIAKRFLQSIPPSGQ